MKKLLIGTGIIFGFIFLYTDWYFLLYQLPPWQYSGQSKARNSGVQANCHYIQMAIERFASEHQGEYPPNLSTLFKESERKLQTTYVFPTLGFGNQYPDYPTGYRKNPYGTQQAASSDIPAAPSDEVQMVYGTGTRKSPIAKTDYGAICYRRSGKQNERYDLSGTGRKRGSSFFPWLDKAICIFHARNY